MTQEHRKLLLKDICARLPYGVKGIITYNGDKDIFTVEGIFNILFLSDTESCHVEDFKPYLFPLSSMTEEEWEDYQKIKMMDWVHGDINGTFINAGLIVDWLNVHHFDYRGLIEKGLAIDATNLNIY